MVVSCNKLLYLLTIFDVKITQLLFLYDCKKKKVEFRQRLLNECLQFEFMQKLWRISLLSNNFIEVVCEELVYFQIILLK